MEIIGKALSSEEIISAVDRTGKKGLAWDGITIWCIVLLSLTKPSELIQIAKYAGVETEFMNLNWTKNKMIQELEKEDDVQ